MRESRFIQNAAQFGVEVSSDASAQLMRYADILLQWNRAHNLISRRDEHRLENRHLLDSVTLLPYLHGNRVLDCGSGAGLPGIPLAIGCPDKHFVLLDRSERKTRFIDHVVRVLKLANVTVACVDMKDFRPEAGFDTITARAVDLPPNLWPIWRPWLAQGGRAVFQYGPSWGGSNGDGQDGDQSQTAWQPPGGRVITTKTVQLPDADTKFGILVVAADTDGLAAPDEEGK